MRGYFAGEIPNIKNKSYEKQEKRNISWKWTINLEQRFHRTLRSPKYWLKVTINLEFILSTSTVQRREQMVKTEVLSLY